MKKMLRVVPNMLPCVFYGESNRKGIYMRLEQIKEYMGQGVRSVSVFRFPGAYACIVNDGTVKVNPAEAEEIWGKELEKSEYEGEFVDKIRKILYVIAVVSFAISLVARLYSADYFVNILMSIFFLGIGFGKIADVIYANIKVLQGDEEMKQCFRFHAAEHAAINAYYDLKRVPSMKEIKNYSNFSYGCSIPEIFEEAWVPLMFGVCSLFSGVWFMFAFLVILMISFWAKKCNFFFTEIFYTAAPTDFEYDVAIQAMTKAVEAKDEMKNVTLNNWSNPANVQVFLEMIASENGNKSPMFCVQIGNPDDLEDE